MAMQLKEIDTGTLLVTWDTKEIGTIYKAYDSIGNALWAYPGYPHYYSDKHEAAHNMLQLKGYGI